jgi:hypothetical protein
MKPYICGVTMPKEKRSKKRGLLGCQGHSGSKAPSDPFLFGCKKKSFESEEKAFNWVSKRMKYAHRHFDWLCFTVYKCLKCGKFHLTKAFNGEEEV